MLELGSTVIMIVNKTSLLININEFIKYYEFINTLFNINNLLIDLFVVDGSGW